MKIVMVSIVVGEVVFYCRFFYYCGIVFIGREYIVWCGFEGVFNYFK